jgi:uncharacterized protein (TIGR02679 family)
MSRSIDERLQRLLGGNHLAELRKRLRRHYERADLDVPQAIIRLGEVSPREYETLASLMGRPTRHASSIQVDVAAIDAALSRVDIAPTLKDALECLDGPIVHVATARAETLSRWASVVQQARHPGLARLLQSAKGLGLLKRLAKRNPDVADRVREHADAVLHRLPVEGLPRAQIAAEILGDAHALDAGQPIATLVLAVLRQTGPTSREASELDLLDEERDRTAWARAGVMVNELARPALFLNLCMQDGARFAAKPGEPAYASLRVLLRSQLALEVIGHTVYVCENPNLVAIAADRLGPRCAPLVCTDGMPAAAQRTLLAHLANAGANLVYHGDFDWPGVRIANFVIRTFGATPWRFSAEDYAAAIARSPGQNLTGTPIPAAWDTSLAPAMQARDIAIPEEAVSTTLLGDLRR